MSDYPEEVTGNISEVSVVTGLTGSYQGQPITIVNEDPSIRFNFNNNVYDRNNETAYTLVSIDYDGWISGSVSKSAWQKLVMYCQEQLSK